MERVCALADNKSAVVAGVLALGTGAVKGDAADTTDIVGRHVPMPGGNGVPFKNFDFHDG